MFQKLIFKPRSKSNKNCIKDTAKNKNKKTKNEKDAEDPEIVKDREKVEKEENKSGDEKVNTTNAEGAREGEMSKEKDLRCGDERKIDDGVQISTEIGQEKDGGAEERDKGADGTEEEGEEKLALGGERSKESGELLENAKVQEVTGIVAIVETQSKTKEKEDTGATEVEAVIENGIETDETLELLDEGTEYAMDEGTE